MKCSRDILQLAQSRQEHLHVGRLALKLVLLRPVSERSLPNRPYNPRQVSQHSFGSHRTASSFEVFNAVSIHNKKILGEVGDSVVVQEDSLAIFIDFREALSVEGVSENVWVECVVDSIGRIYFIQVLMDLAYPTKPALL
jgi:hypothetical protein